MTTEEALVQIQRLSGYQSWAPDVNLEGVNWPELIFLAGHQAGTGAGREPGDEFMAAIAVLLGVEPGDLLSIDQMIERLAPAAETHVAKPERWTIWRRWTVNWQGDWEMGPPPEHTPHIQVVEVGPVNP